MSDTATTSSPDTSPGAASAPATKKSGPRAISLDALKGLIMVVMALDHVRSFFMKYDGVKEIWYQPATYNPDFWSFTARYVSHLAAPGFFFLMGMGMVLFSKSREKIGWDQNQVFKSFLTRGMILIALQFIAEDSAWLIRSHRITHWLSTGVLSSLGGAMIVTAFMLRFKPMVVAAISVACLLASFAVVHSLNMEKADYGFLMTLAFAAGKTGLTKVNYPLVPWIGITGLGLLYGWYWLKDPLRAYKNTLWGGLILVALFCLMRAIDGPWNFRPQVDGSGFSFLQATKYPPSLSWLSLQMGISFLLIWPLCRWYGGFKRSKHPVILAIFIVDFSLKRDWDGAVGNPASPRPENNLRRMSLKSTVAYHAHWPTPPSPMRLRMKLTSF